MTPSRLTALRRRVIREDGIAIVFAVQILAILSLMVAAVLGSAVSLTGATERDYAGKNALAASLSGLDVARYRLEEVQARQQHVPDHRAVATGTSGAATGECPPYVGDLGNGTTYRYYVTPALAVGGTCAGQTITSSTATSRCVTAYGTSDGVTRRTQALIRRDQMSGTLFPFSGILGPTRWRSTSTTDWGAEIDGTVATNGEFKFHHCETVTPGITHWRPGPVATTAVHEEMRGHALTTYAPRSTPWTAAEATSLFTGTPTVNDNVTVFGAASGFEYKADNRELKDKTTATLILNGPNPRTGSGGVWVFNFCKLEFDNATNIKLQNGAVARFLIDSKDRAGSGCTSDGNFKLKRESAMNFDTGTQTPGAPGPAPGPGLRHHGQGRHREGGHVLRRAVFAGREDRLPSQPDLRRLDRRPGGEGAPRVRLHRRRRLDQHEGTTVDQPWARTTPGFVECRSAATTATDPESGC